MMDSATKQLLAYSLTMMLLPSLALAQAQTSGGETGQATPQGASGDDAIYCRPPQPRADSRLRGPKVCMTMGKWKAMWAKGLDVSSDGQSLQQMQNGPLLTGTPYTLSPQP